ncbi:uncharacterized protein LOC126836019 isoform X2 [Adelges cooleyi]|nr:uncharacterized protein LOC126836019 isoform X2 [Adelges cooleyi]XP_050424923.1 uncharacterized protein LOC126836019 isoform X2 [Adelges cooleyi]
MSLISVVLKNTPDEWDNPPVYDTSYILVEVKDYTNEYRNISSNFNLRIRKISRVQNPFQYGRFMLRKEMLGVYCETIAFHGVHRNDLQTALKHTCDYRRYTLPFEDVYDKHPVFHSTFSSLLEQVNRYQDNTHNLCVLIISRITSPIKTQCDYYIKYVVEFA